MTTRISSKYPRKWLQGLLFVGAAAIFVLIASALYVSFNGHPHVGSDSRQVRPPESSTKQRDGELNAGHHSQSAGNISLGGVPVTNTEAEIKASILRLSKTPYSRERQKELNEAGMQLGKAVGIERAMEIVSELFGPGKDRIWMINSITAGTTEPLSTVLAFCRNLEYSDDSNACMAGITRLVARQPDYSADELDRLSPLSMKEVRTIALGLSFKGFHSQNELESRAEIAVGFIKSQSRVEDAESLITEYFCSISTLAPQTALKLWLDTQTVSSPTFESELQDSLLFSVFRRDPKHAIDTIEANLAGGDPKVKGRLAASVVRQWMQIDMNAATEWVSKSNMSGAFVKSSAIVPLYEQELGAGDTEAARKWVMKIEDPEIRRDAEARISDTGFLK